MLNLRACLTNKHDSIGRLPKAVDQIEIMVLDAERQMRTWRKAVDCCTLV